MWINEFDAEKYAVTIIVYPMNKISDRNMYLNETVLSLKFAHEWTNLFS